MQLINFGTLIRRLWPFCRSNVLCLTVHVLTCNFRNGNNNNNNIECLPFMKYMFSSSPLLPHHTTLYSSLLPRRCKYQTCGQLLIACLVVSLTFNTCFNKCIYIFFYFLSIVESHYSSTLSWPWNRTMVIRYSVT